MDSRSAPSFAFRARNVLCTVDGSAELKCPISLDRICELLDSNHQGLFEVTSAHIGVVTVKDESR